MDRAQVGLALVGMTLRAKYPVMRVLPKGGAHNIW